MPRASGSGRWCALAVVGDVREHMNVALVGCTDVQRRGRSSSRRPRGRRAPGGHVETEAARFDGGVQREHPASRAASLRRRRTSSPPAAVMSPWKSFSTGRTWSRKNVVVLATRSVTDGS